MATSEPAPDESPSEAAPQPFGLGLRFRHWLRHDFAYLLGSTVFHAVLLVVAALLSARATARHSEAPSFESTREAQQHAPSDTPLERFDVAETPLQPSELNTETLTLPPPAQLEQAEQKNDDNPVFTERGGGMASGSDSAIFGPEGLSFDPTQLGPGPASSGIGGSGKGTGHAPGIGGSGTGFGGRGTGMRKALLGRYGGTKQSERAVAGALNWLARHQMPDGSWSIDKFPACCKGQACTGTGAVPEPSAATALGLLPFLGSGQTHQSQGPYRKSIHAGINWLIRHEGDDGDLRMGGSMYSQGLATIALCEASGMSRDSTLAAAAQKAIHFIEAAQHPETGGWRYVPRSPGDTSVLGWQVMALKSAQMAGLRVNPRCLQLAGYFLDSVAFGGDREQFNYMPGKPTSDAMTAVGLLCRQYLGMKQDDPTMAAGVAFFSARLPVAQERDLYCWYYATQVLHNCAGPEWDAWNRKMRKILIDSQEREGCAAGSWDPEKPVADAYGTAGGRLMTTSLSALTLEIYYRYLPLYQFEMQQPSNPGASKPGEKKVPAAKTSAAKASSKVSPAKVSPSKDASSLAAPAKENAADKTAPQKGQSGASP